MPVSALVGLVQPGLYVQGAAAGNNVGVNTLDVVLGSGSTAGNLLVATIAIKDIGDVVGSVSGAGTWVKADNSPGASISTRDEIWYCENCSGGVTTFTVTIAAAGTSRIAAAVLEFSGLATSAALDVHGGQDNAASTNVASPSVTPGSAFGVIVASGTLPTTTVTITTWPSGWTQPVGATTIAIDGEYESAAASGSGVEGVCVYKIDPGTSAQSATWVQSVSQVSGSAIAMFLAGGGPDNTTKPAVAGMFTPQLVPAAWF